MSSTKTDTGPNYLMYSVHKRRLNLVFLRAASRAL